MKSVVELVRFHFPVKDFTNRLLVFGINGHETSKPS